MSPQRVQRKRTAGWRAPECSCGSGHTAVYVGRAGAGTKFGNPFRPVRLEIGKWPSEDRRIPGTNKTERVCGYCLGPMHWPCLDARDAYREDEWT